jgi:hypothetical protein
MKLIPGDWLTNAGLLGFLRIRELAGHKPHYSKEFIEIKSSDLNHFTEYYFTAILMRWAEGIFRFRYNILKELQDEIDGEKFDKLSRSSFRDIKPKYYAFSQTQKAVIKAANDYKKKSLDLLSKEFERSKANIDPKDLKKIKKKLGDSISKDIERLRDKSLNFVYIYLQSFYRNKRVIGDPSIGKIRRKRNFYITYVKPAIKQLNNSANTHKFSDGFLCRFCKQNRVMPERFDDVDSIFAEGMFSTTAITISFKNFFYNMQPDLFICKVCQLLLICAWAGFTTIP